MKLSVVMPVFNAEKYLKESIESVLKQSHTDFEFLILNDCSTDGSLKIINDCASVDHRIKVYDFKENKKPAFIRTFAVNEAKTSLIAFADADDIYLPNRFETQLKFMTSNPNVDICGAWFELFGETISSQIIKHKPEDYQIKARFLADSHIGFPTVMIRKHVFDAVKFNTDYFPIEDYEFLAKATTQFRFHNIQEVLVNYRWHETNVSHTANNKISLQLYKVRYNLFKKMFNVEMPYKDSLIYLDALRFNADLEPEKLLQLFEAGQHILAYNREVKFMEEVEVMINEIRLVYLAEFKSIDFKTLNYIKKSCPSLYNTFNFKYKKRLFKKALKNMF